MKLHRTRRAEAGIMLAECLIYIGMWSVVLGVAFSAFYRAFGNATAVRHNADDIAHTLHAGEIWRADVRAAVGAIEEGPVETGRVLQIPTRQAVVLYYFTGTNVLRAFGTNSAWTELIPRVKQSRMTPEPHGNIAAWVWDVELRSTRKSPAIRPIFTFKAVAGKQPAP